MVINRENMCILVRSNTTLDGTNTRVYDNVPFAKKELRRSNILSSGSSRYRYLKWT